VLLTGLTHISKQTLAVTSAVLSSLCKNSIGLNVTEQFIINDISVSVHFENLLTCNFYLKFGGNTIFILNNSLTSPYLKAQHRLFADVLLNNCVSWEPYPASVINLNSVSKIINESIVRQGAIVFVCDDLDLLEAVAFIHNVLDSSHIARPIHLCYSRGKELLLKMMKVEVLKSQYQQRALNGYYPLLHGELIEQKKVICHENFLELSEFERPWICVADKNAAEDIYREPGLECFLININGAVPLDKSLGVNPNYMINRKYQSVSDYPCSLMIDRRKEMGHITMTRHDSELFIDREILKMPLHDGYVDFQGYYDTRKKRIKVKHQKNALGLSVESLSALNL
jgi:hypothetical protein